MWGMDIDIEDGDGTSCDPLSWEIRSSPDYQRVFLCLQMGTSVALGKIKGGTLKHLAMGKGLLVKG